MSYFRDELLAFQISELKFEDDETAENTGQMSIIDFESMAPVRPSTAQVDQLHIYKLSGI